MAITCPKCEREIPNFDVEESGKIIFCRRCNLRSNISELSANEALGQIDLSRAPAGTWYDNKGTAVVVGATHRSIKGALSLLPFMLFWNGIVSFFVVFALSASLHLMHLWTPSFFPEPIMNGKPVTVLGLIGLWLFLTPFILIGLAFTGAFLSLLAGRTELTIDWRRGVLFSGIKKLGFRKEFNPELVKDVRLEDRSWQGKDGEWHESRLVVIETEDRKKPIKFGSQLNPGQLRFITAVLRRQLLKNHR